MSQKGTNAGNHRNIRVIEKAATTSSMDRILYDDGTNHLQLGFLRVTELMDDTYVIVAEPFSVTFAQRQMMVVWTSTVMFVLLVMVYLIVGRLLRRIVTDPIDGTNRSLRKIVDGNLDELVHEVSSVEFASLSAGINTTVDALKGWIDQARRSMERARNSACDPNRCPPPTVPRLPRYRPHRSVCLHGCRQRRGRRLLRLL